MRTSPQVKSSVVKLWSNILYISQVKSSEVKLVKLIREDEYGHIHMGHWRGTKSTIRVLGAKVGPSVSTDGARELLYDVCMAFKHPYVAVSTQFFIHSLHMYACYMVFKYPHELWRRLIPTYAYILGHAYVVFDCACTCTCCGRIRVHITCDACAHT
jgi:hypothetical protein